MIGFNRKPRMLNTGVVVFCYQRMTQVRKTHDTAFGASNIQEATLIFDPTASIRPDLPAPLILFLWRTHKGTHSFHAFADLEYGLELFDLVCGMDNTVLGG
jgi:hypothetical protein